MSGTLAGPLYPVGLVVHGRPCLVVGGGPVAARKVAGLLSCGADVTVVAPELVPAITERRAEVCIEHRPYRSGEAAGYRLVIAATGDPQVDGEVAADADAAGVWVNAADQPDLCSFSLPAVERRGPVTVAVATDGTSPALAGWLRDRLGAALPDDLDQIVAVLTAARDQLHAEGATTEGIDWRARIDALAGGPR